MLPFKHAKLVFNKSCCNVLFVFLSTTDCFFPDWTDIPAIPITSQPAKNTAQVSAERKKYTSTVLMPYCTRSCRIRTFMLKDKHMSLKDKEQFSLPSVRSLPCWCYKPTSAVSWMGMSVISTVPTPQSIGGAGEKMILTEGRRENESQLAQWQRGAKTKYSVLVFIHWECVRCGYRLH